MRKKVIITVILVLVLVLAMIPFGTLYARNLGDADTVMDGDFSSIFDVEGSAPGSGWWEVSGYSVKVDSEGANKVVELYSPNDSSSTILQKNIPITTNNQTFSVDVKPIVFTDQETNIEISVSFYNKEEEYIGYIANYYYPNELTNNAWSNISLNLVEETADRVELGEGFASKDASYITVGAKVFTPERPSGNITITALFDNFKLTSNSAGSSRPLTPDEWVDLNLDMGQLVNHYGATSLGFLGMLYDNSMLRIPDTSGLNYWNEQLTGGVFGANQVVEHFLFSDEIGAKVAAMSSEEYVNFLYSTLFARDPDAEGYSNWLNYINSGFSKEETLRAFLNNEEWINICELFNVTP